MPIYTLPYTKKEDDGRVKLTDEQKEHIRSIYKDGLMSTRQLAAEYNVSRRLIQFVIHPDRLEAFQAYNRSIEHWKIYYDRDKRREAMRAYRKKKKERGFTEYRRE